MVIGAACCHGGTVAFTPPPPSTKFVSSSTSTAYYSSSSLHQYNLRRDDGPDRRGRSFDDQFSPSPRMQNGPPVSGETRTRWEEPPSVDLDGRVVIDQQQSNLSRRMTPSVNDDPRIFDYNQRFSQRPNNYDTPMTNGENDQYSARRSWWESSPSSNTGGIVQGGSRHTYATPPNRDASHVFLESNGRPIDVEFEVWDGPNNTPSRTRVYSEDGRLRPINILSENAQRGYRGNTMSVRNVGPMEFPFNAAIGPIGGDGGRMMMGNRGGEAAMMDLQGGRGAMMQQQQQQQQRNGLAGREGAYLQQQQPFTRPGSPSMKRGERVQGGALRTFPLDYSVQAVQVTITSQGLPVNAKVELWGTSSHVKQLAEIYNDNGQTRPFSAIIDCPGGSNTIAVYNTGPMEYPIEVVVEPVARMEGWNGREEQFGGYLAPW